MSHPARRDSQVKTAKRGERLSDEVWSLVQRQTFRYFWDGAHPVSGLSGLARDRIARSGDPTDDRVATGGSGLGAVAVIVACERGWVTRKQALTASDTRSRIVACRPERAPEKALLDRGNKSNRPSIGSTYVLPAPFALARPTRTC